MKMKKEVKKMCPILQAGYLANSDDVRCHTDCIEHECAFWVEKPYTTENMIACKGICAITLIAIKNSEGKIPV